MLHDASRGWGTAIGPGRVDGGGTAQSRFRIATVVRANRPTPTDPALLEEIVSATMHLPGPEDEVVRHTQRDAAVEALRTLPPEQARAVVLAVIGGRTAVEVSAHEGIPLGTAKTRIRTGLRRVREALGVVDDA